MTQAAISSVCSALFPDVVNCMQTDNLELKKLVYLYLMNYAKSQPDMAIMAVNTFVKVRITSNYLYDSVFFIRYTPGFLHKTINTRTCHVCITLVCNHGRGGISQDNVKSLLI